MPQPQTLVDLLRERCQRLPDLTTHIYLEDGDVQEARLTMGELDTRARAIARHILESGCSAGDRVVLLFPPGIEYIAAFFGCLYAGVVPVPTYPPDPTRLARTLPRFAAITADTGAAAVLTLAVVIASGESLFELAPALRRLRWIASDGADAGSATEWSPPSLTAESLAYVQYTSGSTGEPKGVMLTHGNVLHNLDVLREAFELGEQDSLAFWLPPYHDWGLVGSVLGPVSAEITTVLLSPIDFLRRPMRWLEAISRYGATTSGAPTFAYDLCVRRSAPEERARLDLSHWTAAAIGAETVRPETMERFARAFAPAGFAYDSFYPCYGLAEYTLIVTGGRRSEAPILLHVDQKALGAGRADPPAASAEDSVRVVGCGTPFRDAEVIVVDPENREPCASGQIGEIWASGQSVAAGYWGRPDESRDVFEARPAGAQGGPRERGFLRTGDLGFRNGSELVITGRLKDLIIIRGRNLYPQDIERSAELSHPELRPGCGAAFAAEVDGEERLVVVQEADPARVGAVAQVAAAIREAIALEHEVQPLEVVLVRPRTIPKTSNGKIQRRSCREAWEQGRLERLDESAAAGEESYPARRLDRRSVEDWILHRLAHWLSCDPTEIDPEASLARNGADSLLVVQLLHDLEEHVQRALPDALISVEASVRELAEGAISAPPEFGREIHGERHEGTGPLSAGQRALWYLRALDPESAADHVWLTVYVESELEVSRLFDAMQALVLRHSQLRTAFLLREGELVQEIREALAPDFEVIDASAWEEDRLRESLQFQIERPFDLESPPLIRARVYRRGTGPSALLLVAHHIVVDLWSAAQLLGELLEEYASETARRAHPPMHDYRDFVRWQESMLAGPEGGRHLEHWLRAIEGAPRDLDFPFDRRRPATRGSRAGAIPIRLSKTLSERLRQLARSRDTTLHALLLSAFQVLLHRMSGQADLLVGTAFSGRTRPAWRDIIGHFANVMPIRSHVGDGLCFEDLLAATHRAVVDAQRHQDLPFSVLVEALAPERDPSTTPIFQASFAWEQLGPPVAGELLDLAFAEAGTSITLAGMHLQAMPLEPRFTQFDLLLRMASTVHGLAGRLEYNRDLLEHPSAARAAAYLEQILDAIADEPRARLDGIPLRLREEADARVSGAECTRLWPERRLDEIFEARVDATPDAIAASLGGRKLTYRELDARASAQAQELLAGGVEVGDFVALRVEPSLELLVAVLGILKTGAAYLPVDPSWPLARVRFAIEDSRAKLLLCGSCGPPDGYAGNGMRIRPVSQLIADVPRPRVPFSPSTAAYCLYTSGSTGEPKGVVVTHRNVSSFLLALEATQEQRSSDSLCLFHSYTFDVSVGEMWQAWSCGGRLVVVSGPERASPHALCDLVSRERITVLHLVTTPMRYFVQAAVERPPEDFRELRWILTGGEMLEPDVVRAWYDHVGGEVTPIVNAYGSTEATVHSTWCQLRADDVSAPGSVAGRPLPGTSIHVRDASGEPAPIGVAGEIFIGGVGVAAGYLRRPELTAERFTVDDVTGERLYRTGDIGRIRSDGQLEVLGRRDQQVKLRGHRVEIGEVESVLRSLPEVRDAIVSLWKGDGEARLVAHVVVDGSAATPETLRAALSQKLPRYMVPAAYVRMDSLPRTGSGKLDRKALPAPTARRDAASEPAVAPRNETERKIAEVWRRTLDLDEIGVHDDFFDLGGDSLSAVSTAALLEAAFGLPIDVRLLLRARTVAQAAEQIDALRDQGSPASGHGRDPVTRKRASDTLAEADEGEGTPVRIVRRPLLEQIALGRLEPVDSVAVVSLPRALPQLSGLSPVDLVEDWLGGVPLLYGIDELSLGRIGLVMLPLYDDQLYGDADALVRSLKEAHTLARSVGASGLSLTGLLASATDYGARMVHGLVPGEPPVVTTGHATTAAAVVVNLDHVLALAGRRLADERVGFLGLGSIGSATLRLLLETREAPAALLLCDLPARAAHLASLAEELRVRWRYTGEMRILTGAPHPPAGFERASVVVGATNFPDVLDVRRLAPGTILVDDSGPHCFDVELARSRLEERGDLLFSEGGVLFASEPVRQLRFLPAGAPAAGLPDQLGFLQRDQPRRITGCVLSSLLCACLRGLPATLGGIPDARACRAHLDALATLGIEAASPHCGGYTLASASIERFRERFGARVR